ncbi:MAG: hypothetical protein SGJ27_11255 [Candidatus Melainabacteria bacterium]|nr:hypothetical protein [Candidatus Melainabacteria bacterium]
MMQKFASLFIGVLVLIDAFFIAYAIGINVRKTNIIDPTLPVQAVVKPVEAKPAPTPADQTTPPPAPADQTGPAAATNTPGAKDSKDTAAPNDQEKKSVKTRNP